MIAREDSWPAAEVSALGNYGSANSRILSRRVMPRDGRDDVENPGSSSEGIVLQNPTQHARTPHVSGLAGVSGSVKPMRYLGRADGNPPSAFAFDTAAPAAQFVLPGQLNSSGGPADWAKALADPLRPMPAAPSPQADGTPGISSTVPVSILSRRDSTTPPAFVSDAGAPAARFVLRDLLNNSSGGGTDWAAALAGLAARPQRRSAFAGGDDALSRATGGGSPSSRPGQSQGPTASTLLEYIQRLNQLSGNTSQASMIDANAPGASLAPSDSPVPMGGLAARLAALAGIDPDNPEQPVRRPVGCSRFFLPASNGVEEQNSAGSNIVIK